MSNRTYYIYIDTTKLSDKYLTQAFKNLCDLKVISNKTQGENKSTGEKIEYVKEKLKYAPIVVDSLTVGLIINELKLDVTQIKQKIQYKSKKNTSPIKNLPEFKSAEELSKSIVTFIEELEKMDMFTENDETNSLREVTESPEIGTENEPSTNVTKRLFQTKMDMTGCIPIWEDGNTRLERAINAKTFVTDVERFFEASTDINEAMLIMQALTRSKKKFIYNELPADAKDDVAKFCAHILKTYGPNEVENFMIWKNIKQREGETIRSFFWRVINQFFEVRKKTPLTMTDLEKAENASDRFELAQAFIDGLKNTKVRSMLKSRMLDMKFSDLADHATLIERSYESDVSSINLIRTSNSELKGDIDKKLENTKSEINNQISDLSKQVKELLKVNAVRTKRNENSRNHNNNRYQNYSNYQNDNNKFRETRSCHYCSKQGHIKPNCYSYKRDRENNNVHPDRYPKRSNERNYNSNKRNENRERNNSRPTTYNSNRDNKDVREKGTGWGNENSPNWADN